MRDPYFGQTHLHTGWSSEEATHTVWVDPEISFRHARGERVRHPNDQWVHLKVPLDFHAVSGLAAHMGVPIFNLIRVARCLYPR